MSNSKFYCLDVYNSILYKNTKLDLKFDYNYTKYLKNYVEPGYSEIGPIRLSQLFNLESLGIFYPLVVACILINIYFFLKKKINKKMRAVVYFFDFFTYIAIYVVLPKILFAVFIISHTYFLVFYFLTVRGCIYILNKYWEDFDYPKSSPLFDIKEIFLAIVNSFNLHFLNFCIFFFLMLISIVNNFFFSLNIIYCIFDLIFFFFIFLIFYFCISLLIYLFKNK